MNRLWTTSAWALALGLLVLGGAAQGSDDDDQRESRLSIRDAEWDDEDAELRARGRAPARTLVRLSDAQSLAELAVVRADEDGRWRYREEALPGTPCRLRAESDAGIVARQVEDAPSDCGLMADGSPTDPDPGTDPGTEPAPEPVGGAQIITAFNDLGMHCVDADFSVFSILPPFNVVNAQVITRGGDGEPRILDGSQVELRYTPVADTSGSVNSTSVGKTNFWDINPNTGNRYAEDLFGVSLAPDEGLLGQNMPSAANGPQPFLEFRDDKQWFSAPGIPIVPVDDQGRPNPYPLMRVQAFARATGALLAQSDVVLPVSDETDCSNCHSTGEIGADDASVAWDLDADLEIQSRRNILIQHDRKHGTQLVDAQPVLCAQCHYSPALDLAGQGPQGLQLDLPPFSYAMHGHHGQLEEAGQPVFPVNGGVEETCYQCHPGLTTQCLRGAMADAGMTCQNCHGGMLAVGGEFPLRAGGSIDGLNDGGSRRPWKDLPRCQSCHTGDANGHLGSELILTQAFADDDPSASPLLASNKRFAENDGELYRESLGHGGVACAGCHGSTHAIWPNGDPLANDNVTATQLQGHTGTVAECSTCHEDGSLPLTLDGPHGIHNVADRRWNLDHEDFYERNPSACQACHGRDLRGTALSRAQAPRSYQRDDEDGNDVVQVARGEAVGCALCHDNPLND